jgi:shikimate dehydrogenase
MTKRFAVIGNPVEHSKSPQIHQAFAHQFGISLEYNKRLADISEGGFEKAVQALIKEGYSGANVTVPFKFKAFELCVRDLNDSAISDYAKSAGAVNTLTFSGGKISGDNTDGVGLVTDIQRNLNVSLAQKNVLLMGAGGAAYGVVLPLLTAGAKLTVANRTHEKAVKLAQAFSANTFAQVTAIEYTKLAAFDIVINATSTGLTDDLPEGINDNNFAQGALAYDMMYGRQTKFKTLAESSNKNIKFADGLGMLVEQAAEAFYIWHGVRPDTTPVIQQLRA